MRDAWKVFLVIVGVLALSTVVLFYTGIIGNYYDSTVGKKSIQIQHQNFKQGTPYIDGMVSELQNAKLQYEEAKSKDEKEQIRKFVVEQFANFDPNNIENPDLRDFLEQMETGSGN